VLDHPAREIVLADTTAQRQPVFVVRRANQQCRPDAQNGGLVTRDYTLEGRFARRLKPAPTIVSIDSKPATSPAADDQVLPPVSIHVVPGHAGAQLAELPWQERLARKNIKGLLVMRVPDK